MKHAPPPTEAQLTALAASLGVSLVRHRRRLEGGLGCTMDVVELGDGERAVLRRHGPWWRERGVDAAAREFRVLRVVRAGGVAAPDPQWVDHEDIFSEPAVLISFVPGDPLLRPEDPAAWAAQLAEALATIHDVAVGSEDRALLTPPPPPPEDKLARRVSAHPLGPQLDRLRRRLRAETGVTATSLTHGDFWPGNTLWEGGRLTAVVDWEDAAWGDPAADVAYCTGDIRYQGFDSAAADLIAAYRALTGRPLDSLRYWEAEALCRPLPDIGEWVPAWHALGETTLTVDSARARHTALIEEALAQAPG